MWFESGELKFDVFGTTGGTYRIEEECWSSLTPCRCPRDIRVKKNPAMCGVFQSGGGGIRTRVRERAVREILRASLPV